MLSEKYTVKSESGEPMELYSPDDIPSYRQFYYWYRKEQNAAKGRIDRDGEKDYSLNGCGVTGKTETGLIGPGAVYQIEAAIADVYLVAQYDRMQVIGRPTMYFTIDAYSRMVTGMNVSFEAPSWTDAMMAIENAVSNKTGFCAKYGIMISSMDWPCHHIPNVIIADRCEMMSCFADCLTNKFGIRVENAPSYRTDLIEIIERHFHTINVQLSDLISGKLTMDFGSHESGDYPLDALLDIDEFTAIIIQCVLFYNNNHFMQNYSMPDSMKQAGVKPVPSAIWNWGIENCGIVLKVIPQQEVRLAILPRGKGEITEQGILFKKMHYSCEKAKSEYWFETARNDGNISIEISYDPNDIKVIYCWRKGIDTPYRCVLMECACSRGGRTLAEVEKTQEKQSLADAQNGAIEYDAEAMSIANIDSILEEARLKKATCNSTETLEDISGIKNAHAAEKNKLCNEEAFIDITNPDDTPDNTAWKANSHSTDNPPENKISPQMRILLNLAGLTENLEEKEDISPESEG